MNTLSDSQPLICRSKARSVCFGDWDALFWPMGECRLIFGKERIAARLQTPKHNFDWMTICRS